MKEYQFPAIDREKVGQNIKRHIRMQNLRLEDVRKALNFDSVQSIYHWLNGTSIPSVDNLHALSVLLDVPMEELICGERNLNHLEGGHADENDKRVSAGSESRKPDQRSEF